MVDDIVRSENNIRERCGLVNDSLMDSEVRKIIHWRWLPLALLLLLAACSSNPDKEKRAYLNSGDKYYRSGKYQEAVIQFRNAVQIDPRFSQAHWQLARAYRKLGKSEAAYHELTETVSLEPRNADAQLELAALLLARRQYDEAQAAAQAALKVAPNSARAHAILGGKYILTHDRQNAIQELRQAIDADPRRAGGYAALGAAYLAAGQTAEGEAAYKTGVAVNSRFVQAHLSLGQFWFSQGKMTDAEAEMRTAAGLDPHALLPRLFLARILAATNRLNDAEGLYAGLKSVAPDDPRAYQALGLFYSSRGQKEKAAAEFQSVLASKPKDVAVKAKLIEALIDLKRMKEARALDQEVLSQNPGDPQGLLSNGRMLITEGKYQEATAALQTAIKSEPDCARCYYFLGTAQTAIGLTGLAKASLAHARQLSPQMSGAPAALARLDVQSGDYDEALQLAGAALKADPDLASAYVTEARALISKGDLPKAEGRLEESLKRDGASLPAVATLLSLYMRQGRTQAAVARISKLVDRYPQNPGLHVLLGVAYLNLKDLDKSEANGRQALALDPKAKDAYTLLANIDLARGAIEQAKTHFRAAIEANPSGLTNYGALERQYEKEGDWEEAKKLCERAHQADPASPVVAARLANLYLDHGGDVNIAVSLAQVARQKMPESPVATDTLGWAYYKLGSTKAAVAELTESVQKAPRNSVYQYHLGMAYLADGRLDLAGQSLRRALTSDPHFPDAASARAALDQVSKQPRPSVGK
jgi:tetratricopeptide (TPR) repeat protein